MKQNNSLKTKDMKKLYKILFEGKKPEEQPLKLEIKLKSTATPDEQLDINTWFKLVHDLNNKKLTLG
jgi:polyisoprenoid-binding protein YceI